LIVLYLTLGLDKRKQMPQQVGDHIKDNIYEILVNVIVLIESCSLSNDGGELSTGFWGVMLMLRLRERRFENGMLRQHTTLALLVQLVPIPV
jgi:hypothetical protein